MAVKINNIHKMYNNGFKALTGLSLEIERGKFTAILGSSGAGKSTLLRTINGLETITSGSITVSGVNVCKKNLRTVRSDAAMVFQNYNLVNRLSVMANVLTGRLSKRNPLLSLLHLFPKEDYAIASDALTCVGMEDRPWSRADKLSGGQQQRIGIARALAQNPSIILADEPVASLDPVSSTEVLTLLKKIAQDRNITVVTSLHQVDFAKEYADRIIGMNKGQIVFDGAPAELTENMLERIYQKPPEKEVADVQMEVSYA